MVRKGLVRNYAYLRSSCETSLVPLAAGLFQVDIITDNVKSAPSYEHIQRDFINIIYLSESVSDMEVKCKCFLEAFRIHGGPMTAVADRVQREWLNKMSIELGIQFLTN